MRVLASLVSLLAVVLVAAAVGAQPRPSGPPGPPGAAAGPPPVAPDVHLVELARRAGIEADTLARLRAMSDPSRAERDRLRDAIDRARQALYTLLDTDAPDIDAVMAALADLSDAELALQQHDMRLLIEMRGTLSPEQRTALDNATPGALPPR